MENEVNYEADNDTNKSNIKQPAASTPVNGTDLFEETIRLTKILTTGCPKLDTVLDGGVFTGEMTEIYGCPGSGKTQFALTLAAHTVSNRRHVVYIDTCSSFVAERFLEILQAIENQSTALSPESKKKCLSGVKVCAIFDIFQCLCVLESVEQQLRSECDDFYMRVKLVVIDSVAALITPILTGTHGYALMSRLANKFKMLAYEYGVAVVVINNSTVNHQGREARFPRYKPTLGATWLKIPATRIWIDIVSGENSGARLCVLQKHSRTPCGKSCKVFVGARGVTDTDGFEEQE